jgi:hypothetical protein
MATHLLIGVVMIGAGLHDAASGFWLTRRVRDERQRAAAKLALLSSGFVVAALGGAFYAGLFQR